MTRYASEFTSASLSENLLTINHGLSAQYLLIQIYDNNNYYTVPDLITLTDVNNFTVNLTTFAPISGTWHVVYI